MDPSARPRSRSEMEGRPYALVQSVREKGCGTEDRGGRLCLGCRRVRLPAAGFAVAPGEEGLLQAGAVDQQLAAAARPDRRPAAEPGRLEALPGGAGEGGGR